MVSSASAFLSLLGPLVVCAHLSMFSWSTFPHPAAEMNAKTPVSNTRANMARAYRGDTFRAMAPRRILTLALALAGAAPAAASPRSDPTAGRAVFTGATTHHATSIVLDPAALGLGQFDELYL